MSVTFDATQLEILVTKGGFHLPILGPIGGGAGDTSEQMLSSQEVGMLKIGSCD